MASTNPNQLKNVLPGAGTSFAVNGSTEIFTGSVDTACLAANVVTSAKLAANLLQRATITLTPTQIKAMYATPVQVIAAPGAGLTIVVEQAFTRFTYTTPQYTAGGAVVLQYDSTAHGAGTAVVNTLAAAVLTAAASADTTLPQSASNVTCTQNKGIFVSNDTAAFATGTVSTLEIDIWYRVQ